MVQVQRTVEKAAGPARNRVLLLVTPLATGLARADNAILIDMSTVSNARGDSGMNEPDSIPEASPSQRIDTRIAELADWRGAVLAQVRNLIRAALPDVVETWKWNLPVWEHGGILCTGEAYKQAVKLTFPKGASLSDPAGLFNASLEGNARRAIDIRQGDAIDGEGLMGLMRAAAALNAGAAKKKTKAS